MVEARILVPLEFGGLGCTGSLTLGTEADLAPGFHRSPAIMGIPMPAQPRQVGFLGTAQLAYRVALNYYGLSAGLSIEWSLVPCLGGLFPGFAGGSAGAAFLLALLRMRIGTPMSRPLWRDGKLEEAIDYVRLDWVAASATIDKNGDFGPVDLRGLILKLDALVREEPISGVRLAVVAQKQLEGPNRPPLAAVERMPGLFKYGNVIPVIGAANAEDCYRTLFCLQSQQVLL